MKNIIVLSYHFSPDLSAGAFRNSSLVEELSLQIGKTGKIHVITTEPNRYKSFDNKSMVYKDWEQNIKIHRIAVPEHQNGLRDQIRSYFVYYKKATEISKKIKADLVYASSSKLFTAYLGKVLAKRAGCPLYLDIRDIFVDTMVDVFNHRPVFKALVIPFITKFVETPTFQFANHINLVSGGFEEYFAKRTKAKLTFYTNGIDEEFLGIKGSVPQVRPYIITYAGNIGEGQGLEKIIPVCAKELGNKFLFKIIGDGGTKGVLEDLIKENKLENVEILKPIKRNELVEIYKNSHLLFLHLNDYKAFKKVLPSKIFEYAATNLPIVAGVSGYASYFIKKNIPNSFVFDPCDCTALSAILREQVFHVEDRNLFVSEFRRSAINQNLATSILSYLS